MPRRFEQGGIYHVRTECELPLHPWEPDDYIVEYRSELYAPSREDIERGRRGPRAVRANWAVVNIIAAMDEGEDLAFVFDAKSADFCALYEVLTGHINSMSPDVPCPFANFGNLLYLHEIKVAPAYAAERFSIELLEHILRFEHAAGAAFLQGKHDPPYLVAAVRNRGFELIEQDVMNTPCYLLDLGLKRPPLPNDDLDRKKVRQLPTGRTNPRSR